MNPVAKLLKLVRKTVKRVVSKKGKKTRRNRK